MTPGQNTEAFTQEIAALEAQLAAKKQEMLRAGIESPERTVFKQVVREHGQAEALRTPIPTGSTASSAAPVRAATPEEEQRINLLVAHAFTKGLSAAIAEAKKTGDPFFIDLLHDRLADEYYQKLLAARKVNSS